MDLNTKMAILNSPAILNFLNQEDINWLAQSVAEEISKAIAVEKANKASQASQTEQLEANNYHLG